MELAVLHDGEEPRLVLQDTDIGGRVAIDQQQVSKVALLDHAEFVRHAHDLAAEASRGDKRLHWREAEQVDKILEILRVGALRRPGEPVVPADQYANAAAMHL